MCRFADASFQASVTSCHPPLPSPNTLRKYVRCHQKGGVPGLLDSTPTGMYLSRALPPRISVLTGCLTHLGPAGASWGQLVPAGASWYNTLKLASCHVHRPCPNPLQSPHRVITSKQESSTSLVSQFGKSVKCLLYD